MSSGFLPGLFSSSPATGAGGCGSVTTTNNNNGNGINIIQQQQQQPEMYNSHGFRSQSGIGKRTLAEFQNQQYLLLQQNRIGVGGFPMRSVKPRIYQNVSPISPLSPIDLLPEIGGNGFVGRYGVPQMRHQNSLGYGTGCVVPTPTGNVSYNRNMMIHGGIVGRPKEEDTEVERKMMMSRLHELEKQLLDDEEEVEDASGDSVSAITGNEWSETIRNLLGEDQKIPPLPQQQQVTTSSPTSSSSSSSCSSTVASPLSICPKQSIIEAATAIADGKSESAAEIVARLTQSSNPRGTPEQRLAYYMALALKSKLSSVEGQKSYSEIRSEEHFKSVQLLYQHSRCFNLGFLAATLAVIEATEDVKSLHVVDFGMGNGEQHQNLLQLLSFRKSGKPTAVKITAVDVVESGVGLVDEERIVSEKLSQLSERVGVPFELKILRLKIGELNRESLRSNDDEVLAVNLPYTLSKLPDESVSTENQRDELLRRVKGLNARIVTVVEEEMNCNTAPFQTRAAECCSFYGAVLESMDLGMGRDDAERVRVEEGLGRRMLNSVACEGGERVERCELLGKWRARMGMAGFELKPVSQNMVGSLSSRFNNNINSGPLSVKESNGGVCFGWMGRILTVTSAWR